MPRKQFENKTLTIELKEQILSKPCIRVDEIMLLTGYSDRMCYKLMDECRRNFNGRAGIRTDAITPTSLCKALGTTIEEQMRLIGIAKGYIQV